MWNFYIPTRSRNALQMCTQTSALFKLSQYIHFDSTNVIVKRPRIPLQRVEKYEVKCRINKIDKQSTRNTAGTPVKIETSGLREKLDTNVPWPDRISLVRMETSPSGTAMMF